MISDFHEAVQPDAIDPVDGTFADFDWTDLWQRLGEEETDTATDHEIADALMRMLRLLLEGCGGELINPRTAGLRLIAIAWTLNPGLFTGGPSLRTLARRCNVSPAALARLTGEASRSLRWRNRAQRHAGNWRKMERSALL
jgi:AraC-like DNA-binding protein